MSTTTKDTISFIGRWLVTILVAITGFILSTSYLSITEDIKQTKEAVNEIDKRLIRIETKLKN